MSHHYHHDNCNNQCCTPLPIVSNCGNFGGGFGFGAGSGSWLWIIIVLAIFFCFNNKGRGNCF